MAIPANIRRAHDKSVAGKGGRGAKGGGGGSGGG